MHLSYKGIELDSRKIVKKSVFFIPKKVSVMSQLPLFIRVSPASHEDLPTWNAELLWHLQSTDDIVNFIREKMVPEVKSGLVMYRDLTDNSFKVINFRGKNILQPVQADGVVKLKRETKKGLTFEEKIELLKRFVLEEGHEPNADDVFESCRVGTFYKSLLNQKKKYENYVNELGSPASTRSDSEDASPGADGGNDDGQLRGGRRSVRRGGHVKKSSE